MDPYAEDHFHDQSPPSNSAGLLRFRSAPSSLLSSFRGHDFIQSKSAAVDSSSPNQFPPQSQNPNSIRVDAPMDQSTQGKLRLDRSNLARQSSSPAGFFSNLTTQDGYGMVGGMESFRFSTCSSSSSGNGEGQLNPHLSRLKAQIDLGPRQSTSIGHLPRIPELGAETTNDSGSEDNARFHSHGFSFNSWNDNPSQTHVLSHHLSLPKTSAEMAAVEKLLNFQDAVPCKIRAKRGCATHPRSIAERVRRTRISDKMKKLQELVPNMDKQVNTSEMLDLAVDYIKDLQKQYKMLSDNRARCKCLPAQQSAVNRAS